MNAKLLRASTLRKLSDIRGIEPIKVKAALYMRVKFEEFEDIRDDMEFCQKLLEEQCCLLIPSKCFFAKDFFRMVYHFRIIECRSFASRRR